MFKKSSYKNKPTTLWPKSLKLLYNESQHNILALVGKANKNSAWKEMFTKMKKMKTKRNYRKMKSPQKQGDEEVRKSNRDK
jgi:hypothetical protein